MLINIFRFDDALLASSYLKDILFKGDVRNLRGDGLISDMNNGPFPFPMNQVYEDIYDGREKFLKKCESVKLYVGTWRKEKDKIIKTLKDIRMEKERRLNVIEEEKYDERGSTNSISSSSIVIKTKDETSSRILNLLMEDNPKSSTMNQTPFTELLEPIIMKGDVITPSLSSLSTSKSPDIDSNSKTDDTRSTKTSKYFGSSSLTYQKNGSEEDEYSDDFIPMKDINNNVNDQQPLLSSSSLSSLSPIGKEDYSRLFDSSSSTSQSFLSSNPFKQSEEQEVKDEISNDFVTSSSTNEQQEKKKKTKTKRRRRPSIINRDQVFDNTTDDEGDDSVQKSNIRFDVTSSSENMPLKRIKKKKKYYTDKQKSGPISFDSTSSLSREEILQKKHDDLFKSTMKYKYLQELQPSQEEYDEEDEERFVSSKPTLKNLEYEQTPETRSPYMTPSEIVLSQYRQKYGNEEGERYFYQQHPNERDVSPAVSSSHHGMDFQHHSLPPPETSFLAAQKPTPSSTMEVPSTSSFSAPSLCFVPPVTTPTVATGTKFSKLPRKRSEYEPYILLSQRMQARSGHGQSSNIPSTSMEGNIMNQHLNNQQEEHQLPPIQMTLRNVGVGGLVNRHDEVRKQLDDSGLSRSLPNDYWLDPETDRSRSSLTDRQGRASFSPEEERIIYLWGQLYQQSNDKWSKLNNSVFFNWRLLTKEALRMKYKNLLTQLAKLQEDERLVTTRWSVVFQNDL